MRKSMSLSWIRRVEFKLGARGLRSIVEAVMMDAMFEIPSKKVKTFNDVG